MKKNNVINLVGRDWWKEDREPSETLELIRAPFRPFTDSKTYTPKEVGEVLKRSVWTVYRYIKEGKLEAEPLERGYLIRGKCANDYLFRLRMKKRAG